MKPHPSAKQGWGLHFVALPGSQFGRNSPNFVILGRSDAKRSEDPSIHAVTSAEGRKGAKFCTVASHWRNGRILGSVYIQDSQFGESLIQAAGWMEVSMDGPTGTE